MKFFLGYLFLKLLAKVLPQIVNILFIFHQLSPSYDCSSQILCTVDPSWLNHHSYLVLEMNFRPSTVMSVTGSMHLLL